MAFSNTERIDIIKKITRQLSLEDDQTARMILEVHGVNLYEGYFQNLSDFIMSNIKNGDESVLRGIEDYLEKSSIPLGNFREDSAWKQDGLKLFFSHLSTQRHLIGSVAEKINGIGLNAFVAHESIAPTNDWLEVIEGALSTSDGMVAFIHPGFRESEWCDHEIGWGIGRKIPILPLSFGVSPYGLLGSKQHNFVNNSDPNFIYYEIIKWIHTVKGFKLKFENSVTLGLVNSKNFMNTINCINVLEDFSQISSRNYELLLQAAKSNDQVYKCNVGYRGSTADKIIESWKTKVSSYE